MFQFVSCTMSDQSWKFHESLFMRFPVMLLKTDKTDGQTDRQTDRQAGGVVITNDNNNNQDNNSNGSNTHNKYVNITEYETERIWNYIDCWSRVRNILFFIFKSSNRIWRVYFYSFCQLLNAFVSRYWFNPNMQNMALWIYTLTS